MNGKTRSSARYVGVDIGGTKIAAGLVNGEGKMLRFKKMETPADGTGEQVCVRVKKVVQDLLRESGLSAGDVRGISTGIPGIVRPDHQAILRTPNISLSGFPLAEKLRDEFKVEVVLGNDVNFGLLGETWLGAAKEADNVVGLFPGTGVGGAVIVDGRMVGGEQGAAGELGHMIVDFNSKKQSAGLFGTLEALASRRAIERDIREGIKAGEKSLLAAVLRGEKTVIKSKVIADALLKKDPLVIRIINETCRVLGLACVSIRHILNPGMIILGGGVIEACGDYMLPRIRRISSADPFFKGIDACRIERSALGDDAVILGAVCFLKQLLGDDDNSGEEETPELSTDEEGRVYLNGRKLTENIFIRADGKVKKIDGKPAFAGLTDSHQLDARALKKFCKKKPREFIIVADGASPKVTAEGKDFLERQLIKARILKPADAVSGYRSASGKKAILFYRRSSG